MIYAYTRISTNKATQKTDRQIENIKQFAIENNINVDDIIFINETISGKTDPNERPKYKHLKSILKTDDVLIINELDRLGRNADSTILEVKTLQMLNIKLIILDIPYLNKLETLQNESIYKMIIDILITLKSHIAQQEREQVSQRVKQGLLASDKKGGRPNTTIDDIPKDFIKHYDLYKSGKINKSDLSRLTNLSRPTVDKYIKMLEDN